jgi:hypothetical protein
MQKKPRIVMFVCSGITREVEDYGILISKMIEAGTIEEARNIFEKENGIKPEAIHGPFYKKQTGTLDKNFDIEFAAGKKMTGTFNGWHIDALQLKKPEDSVYVIYNKSVDGKKQTKPNAMIVKINEKGLEIK